MVLPFQEYHVGGVTYLAVLSYWVLLYLFAFSSCIFMDRELASFQHWTTFYCMNVPWLFRHESIHGWSKTLRISTKLLKYTCTSVWKCNFPTSREMSRRIAAGPCGRRRFHAVRNFSLPKMSLHAHQSQVNMPNLHIITGISHCQCFERRFLWWIWNDISS